MRFLGERSLLDSLVTLAYSGVMKQPTKLLPALLIPFLWMMGCRQVVDVFNIKQITSEVVAGARQPESWYTFIPSRAPGFCLMSRCGVVWRDPKANLGWWVARHYKAPHRVMMEARGNTFILRRSYVWDGMTWGKTTPKDLFPTLLHDALYHALRSGAPVKRREIDRLFLRIRRKTGVSGAYAEYMAIRLVGGVFVDSGDSSTRLLIERTSPWAAPVLPVPVKPATGER